MVLLAGILGGCVDMGAIVDALAKDPNAICVTITTLYGSALFDRNHGCANPGQPALSAAH